MHAWRDVPGCYRDASGTRWDAAGTQPGRAGATGGEEEQDFSVPPALATPESRLALTQLRVAITSRTRNTISRLGVTVKPVSLPPNLQYLSTKTIIFIIYIMEARDL